MDAQDIMFKNGPPSQRHIRSVVGFIHTPLFSFFKPVIWKELIQQGCQGRGPATAANTISTRNSYPKSHFSWITA